MLDKGTLSFDDLMDFGSLVAIGAYALEEAVVNTRTEAEIAKFYLEIVRQ